MAEKSTRPATFEIQHKFIPFGMGFGPVGESVATDSGKVALGIRSIAVDVGAECPPLKGEAVRMVFDHHFTPADGRPQHPSAAAAVFMNARRILAWRDSCLADGSSLPFQIITHSNPDFDALSASWLVRTILLEAWPADPGYTALRSRLFRVSPDKSGMEIYDPSRWYPSSLPLGGEPAWAFNLASYASRVDNCKRLSQRRERRPHSVLYAALERGRDYRTDGLSGFFEEVRASMRKGFSPLHDELFDVSGPFGPELGLLDESVRAYARDLARARKTLVSVPQALTDEARGRLNKGLLSEEFLVEGQDGILCPRASQLGGEGVRSAIDGRLSLDGIFLRDPECLFFKEWAREDRENSILGEGFLFTAVAYSNMKEGGSNKSEYYFSLDPERTSGLHLYPLWAALQAAEISAMQAAAVSAERHSAAREATTKESTPPIVKARDIFAARAGAHPEFFTSDRVWYDGSNAYHSTIVVTPAGGTLLAEGHADDLSDDLPARIVSRILEFGFFKAEAEGQVRVLVADYPANPDASGIARPVFDTPHDLRDPGSFPSPSPSCYRFAKVLLAPDAPAEIGVGAATGENIGRILWPLVDPTGTGEVPTDFLQGHLVVERGRVSVWSRYGIAVAHVGGAVQEDFLKAVDSSLDLLSNIRSELPRLGKEVGELIKTRKTESGAASDLVKRCRTLSGQVASLELDASRPDGILIRRFLSATNLDAVIATVSELSEQIHAAQDARRDFVLQKVLAWGTAIGLAFAWAQIDEIIWKALGLAMPEWTSVAIGAFISIAFMGIYYGSSASRYRKGREDRKREG